jgi:23S rRNA pseudouridine2457 synthase
MARVILLNKPCGVISQFSGTDPRQTLAGYVPHPSFYPAGRLDKDSEGLLVLTDDGRLQQHISHPRHGKQKTYLVQVEGEINELALATLRRGVKLKEGPSRPTEAHRITEPKLWPRDPPIRYRKEIPTSWIELKLREGRNRQVRRMTAAVGFPTLRLVRIAVGHWQIGSLEPGQWKLIEEVEVS